MRKTAWVKIPWIIVLVLLVLIAIVGTLNWSTLSQLEKEMRRECALLGLESLYIEKDTLPYTYYCMELPGAGQIGIVILLEVPPTQEIYDEPKTANSG